ncbi:MAG: hypothetical protein WDZ91_05575 [Paenibacillaceae bacterium]
MKNEFFLDLIFVQDQFIPEDFLDAVKTQLVALFTHKGHWHLEAKQEGLVSIIVVEVTGMWRWDNEEQILDYLEKAASSEFWEWLYGYQIQLDVKQHAECSHCGKQSTAV